MSEGMLHARGHYRKRGICSVRCRTYGANILNSCVRAARALIVEKIYCPGDSADPSYLTDFSELILLRRVSRANSRANCTDFPSAFFTHRHLVARASFPKHLNHNGSPLMACFMRIK